MKQRVLCVTLIGAALLVAGCTPPARAIPAHARNRTPHAGDLVWPPQMRVEPGPSGERADYQTVSLER
jgi:hypothetical protein